MTAQAKDSSMEFDYSKFLHSATQAVYGFSFLYIIYELKMNELHMEALLLQHKQDVIAHFDRSGGINALLMGFFIVLGYLSTPLLNAFLASIFQNSGGAASVKEATIWDHMFCYDSVCANLSLSQLLFWGILVMLLGISLLWVYSMWLDTRAHIARSFR